jgi:hypothetical protein
MSAGLLGHPSPADELIQLEDEVTQLLLDAHRNWTRRAELLERTRRLRISLSREEALRYEQLKLVPR